MSAPNESKKPVEPTESSESASQNSPFSPILSGTSTASVSSIPYASTNVAAHVISTGTEVDSTKAKTLRWASEHKDELRKFAGQWILVEDGRVLVVESTMLKALGWAEDHDVRSPVVIYIEDGELDSKNVSA